MASEVKVRIIPVQLLLVLLVLCNSTQPGRAHRPVSFGGKAETSSLAVKTGYHFPLNAEFLTSGNNGNCIRSIEAVKCFAKVNDVFQLVHFGVFEGAPLKSFTLGARDSNPDLRAVLEKLDALLRTSLTRGHWTTSDDLLEKLDSPGQGCSALAILTIWLRNPDDLEPETFRYVWGDVHLFVVERTASAAEQEGPAYPFVGLYSEAYETEVYVFASDDCREVMTA